MSSLPIGEVICGDCFAIMKRLPDKSIDCVLTDPPYDSRTHSGGRFNGSFDIGNVNFQCIDSEIQSLLVKEWLRITRTWIIAFCTFEQVAAYVEAAGDAWVRTGVWDRISPSPQLTGDRPGQAAEGIAIMHPPGKKIWNGGGKAGIWRYRHDSQENGASKVHPTQKPEGLMRALVADFTQPGDLILDPFCGSGTTLTAAERLGRRWVGIDISPEYCEIARKRTAQKGLPLAMEAP